MSINPEQFRSLVVVTLGALPIPVTPEAVAIVLMTCAHESELGTFLVQQGGPARGIGQMEPFTLESHYTRLRERPALLAAVEALRPPSLKPVDAIVGCLPFAIAMTRVHYLLCPGAIPKTLEGMAAYAKQFYNGPGKATPEAYLRAYRRFYP